MVAKIVPSNTAFKKVYNQLTDLANDTGFVAGTVLCRVINGHDVSFTRNKTTFLRFESPSFSGKKMSLYETADFISQNSKV